MYSIDKFRALILIFILLQVVSFSIIYPASGSSISNLKIDNSKSINSSNFVNSLNFQIISEDSVSNSSVHNPINKSLDTNAINGASKSTSFLYINNVSNSNSQYDEGDVIIEIQSIKGNINSSKNEAYLHQFGSDQIIIDWNINSEFDNSEPIFHDSDGDMKLGSNDSFSSSGYAPIISFDNSTENESYFDYNGDNSYNSGEAIYQYYPDQGCEIGSLSSGNMSLMMEGRAPIMGFDETAEYERVFDVDNDDGAINFDPNEAVMSTGENDSVTSGLLSKNDDYVLKRGKAKLNNFNQNETFHIDSINSTRDRLNQGEVIIDDLSGDHTGKIDGNDQILKGGYALVREVSGNVATFGTGDVYIGNSNDNAVYESGEYIFVESGDNIGYQPNEDLIITCTKTSDPSDTSSSVHLIQTNDSTNIVFLDLNRNGRLDSKAEGQSSPGVEPIVRLDSISDVNNGRKLTIYDSFLNVSSSNSSYLDVSEKCIKGSEYQDLSTTRGPHYNNTLEYSDSSNARSGVYDSGDLLLEEGGNDTILEPNDYVINQVSMSNYLLESMGGYQEFLDMDNSGDWSTHDPIISSDVPDDRTITKQDSIIYSGGDNNHSKFRSNIEFIDTNGDSHFTNFEPVIYSNIPGDSIISTSDQILRQSSNPGQVYVSNFDGDMKNEDGFMEVFISNSQSSDRYSSEYPIVEVRNVTDYNSKSDILEQRMSSFNSSIGYIETTNNCEFDANDIVYTENDNQTIGPNDFGDSLETVTVRNVGTLDDSEIASIALLQNGTEIANTSHPTNGTWVLSPPPDTGWFGPENGSEFEFRTRLADNATAGDTVELKIPPVSDGGTVGRYDPGDTGVFFDQDSPTGHIGPGPTLTVEADSTSDGSGDTHDSAPVPELNVSLDLPDGNITTRRAEIPVTIHSSVPDRSLVARLQYASNDSTVASKQVFTDADGNASVAFETRRGQYHVLVRDSETDAEARSSPVTVHPPGTVLFGNESITAKRGSTPTVGIEFHDSERATLRIRNTAGKPLGLVTLEDDGDGLARIDLDTDRIGRGRPASGLLVRDVDNLTTPVGKMASRWPQGPNNRSTGPNRSTRRPGRNVGFNRSPALGAGRYSLSLSHRGNVTDTLDLRLTADWSASVDTYVAPRGANLSNVSAVRRQATRRKRVALGDVLVVKIRTSGMDGYVGRRAAARGRGRAKMPPGAAARVHSLGRGRNRSRHPLNYNTSTAAASRFEGNDTCYLILGSNQTSAPRVRPGKRYGASFALSERSPFVPGTNASNETRNESIGTNFTFVEPEADFRNLSRNGTLDLPATANVSIAGMANVAPGTEVSITLDFNGTNETVAERTVVEENGTYEESVNLTEYDGGTTYTVSVETDGERISPLRTGVLVEEGGGFSAAAGGSGGGGGGGAGGWGDHSESDRTTQAIGSTATGSASEPTSTEPTTEENPFHNLPLHRFPDDPADVIPTRLHVGWDAIAIGLLGLVALLVLFVGVRRLL